MFPFFVLLACGSSEQSQQMTSVPPPIEQPSVAVGSSSFDEENTKDLIRILSAYDGKSNCTGLPEQGLQEKLTHIVEHVSLPPWAPMRAASCLSQPSSRVFIDWLSYN